MKRAIARLSAVGFVATVLFVLGSSSAGCGPSCPPTERVVDEGVRWSEGATRYYQSSGPDGPFLPFEGGTLLRIRHGLGIAPEFVQLTLAFNARPQAPGGGGYSYAAGNQALVTRQDAEEIDIRNDSCASYYIRVYAKASPNTDAGLDATTDTGATTDASDGG